jgi:hypothetical protein
VLSVVQSTDSSKSSSSTDLPLTVTRLPGCLESDPEGRGVEMGSDEVRDSAARIQQIGDDVRRLADRTLAASAGQWRSPAATRFHRCLVEEVARIRAVAADLDGAAEALLRHAVAVDGGLARTDGGVR